MAKYKVRGGFVLHLEKTINGKKTYQPIEAGSELDLTPEQYQIYKHQLEPVKAASSK